MVNFTAVKMVQNLKEPKEMRFNWLFPPNEKGEIDKNLKSTALQRSKAIRSLVIHRTVTNLHVNVFNLI